jgi:hypothetical protein
VSSWSGCFIEEPGTEGRERVVKQPFSSLLTRPFFDDDILCIFPSLRLGIVKISEVQVETLNYRPSAPTSDTKKAVMRILRDEKLVDLEVEDQIDGWDTKHLNYDY